MRHFRDKAGVEWQVFLTARGSDAVSREHFLPEAYREGWLVFESSQEKRRLAPVPPNWESLPNEALAALCDKASPQLPRIRGGTEGKTASPSKTGDGEPLKPKLQEAEHQLDRTLEEVCATPTAAARLDTGQLIRVEESLALAAEAAKEAVSLRRKLKAERDRDPAPPLRPSPGGSEPPSPASGEA
jgi:hypothetical protein